MRDKVARDERAADARMDKMRWCTHEYNLAGQKNVLEPDIGTELADRTEGNPAEPYRARLYDAIERQVGEPTLSNILAGISRGIGEPHILQLQEMMGTDIGKVGSIMPFEVLKAIRDYKPTS